MSLVSFEPAALYAQEALGTVVIVRVPRDAAVVARIRAELEANDWRVRELGPDGASARASLPAVATSARARAALRMNPSRGAVELWVASEGNAAGGGEVVRLPGGEDDDALLALRATEALRARGLRLPRTETANTTPPASGGTPSAPAATSGSSEASADKPAAAPNEAEERARKLAEEQARAERERLERERLEKERLERERVEKERAEKERAEREARERAEAEAAEEAEAEEQAEAEENESDAADTRASLLFVEGGPAIAVSPGHAGPSWAGWLNFRLQPAAAWSVSGFAFLPFAGGTFTWNQGESEGWIRSFMLGGTFDLHGGFDRIDLSAGAGAAMLITLTGATSDDPRYVDNDEHEITAAALARVGLHVTVTPRIRIGARVVFGLAVPKLEVVLPEEEPATWGQPFALATVVVDFGLPVTLR